MEMQMRGEFIILIDGEMSGRIYCANTDRTEGFRSFEEALIKLRRFMQQIQLAPDVPADGIPFVAPGEIAGFRLFIQGLLHGSIKGFALIDGDSVPISDDQKLFMLVNRETRAGKARLRIADNAARFRERSLSKKK